MTGKYFIDPASYAATVESDSDLPILVGNPVAAPLVDIAMIRTVLDVYSSGGTVGPFYREGLISRAEARAALKRFGFPIEGE